MNVLVVKGNNRPAEEAISSKMYETFLAAAKENEKLNITTYNVFSEDMPYLGQDLFGAYGKMAVGEELTDIETRLLAAKQKAMDAVTAADVIVFAFPLWNLTIPAKLQTFIDYIFAAGFAFKYDETGTMVALMPEKKVILLNARGGYYSAPEMAPMDMGVTHPDRGGHAAPALLGWRRDHDPERLAPDPRRQLPRRRHDRQLHH